MRSIVRNGASAPPHHEGQAFRDVEYPTPFFSLALSHCG
jgi:hypothetical protein